MIAEREIADAFACFGGSCGTIVRGDGEARSAADAVALARRRLLAWHDRFTRFEPGSELSSVNRDPRDVAVSFFFQIRHRATDRELSRKGFPADVRRLQLAAHRECH